MQNLIFYGAGEHAQFNLSKWISDGLIPTCFADKDEKKHYTKMTSNSNEFEILPLCEAIERYPDYEIFISVGGPEFLSVVKYLIEKGISQENIYNKVDYNNLFLTGEFIFKTRELNNNNEIKLSQYYDIINIEKYKIFNNAKIVYLASGLANQIFRYIFLRFLEVKFSFTCFFYDKDLQWHNGYELGKIWGLKPRLLSDYLSDNWCDILNATENIKFIDLLKINNIDVTMCLESHIFREEYFNSINLSSHKCVLIDWNYNNYSNNYEYNNLNINGTVYYYGQWICNKYFYEIRDIILEELKFPEFDDEYNIKIANMIENSNSVGIHVRRGDYLEYNMLLDTKWYQETLPKVRAIEKNPLFFVFSDEPDWCKQNFLELGLTAEDKIVFVEGNVKGKNFRDMQHMSLCKYLVQANSTFSYAAALFNQNLYKNKNHTWSPNPRYIL